MSFDQLTTKRLASSLLIALCLACKPSPAPAAKPVVAGPQVKATVITLRTTVQPENKTFERRIVISGDRARDTGELDTWRLYDLEAKTITFVDDVAKTIRTESLATVVARHEAGREKSLPSHYPNVKYSATQERRTLQGVTAERSLIESGAYRRELWMGEHPAIPRGLFGMMQASEAPSSPLAPMTRAVDEALIKAPGFPLADRTTVPLGNVTLIVERTVTVIAEQPVAESVLSLPKGYRDLTPKPKPKPAANAK